MTVNNITAATYQTEVLDYSGVALVAYCATGSSTSEMIVTGFEKLIERYGEQVKCATVAIETEEQLLIDNGIVVVPTILVYKNGEKKQVLQGGQLVSQLERALTMNL